MIRKVDTRLPSAHGACMLTPVRSLLRTLMMIDHPPLTAETTRLSVLVPVYRGEASIEALVDTVVESLRGKANLWEIVLVNDGSPDNSHARILSAMQKHPDLIRYVRLYRNFGEHNAVMCGLNHITGDCVAIIDDDFQNPPTEILALI